MRGRKPKPTRLKVLEGNPGKRPLNDAEPEYPPGAGEPPEHLDELARGEWNRVNVLLTAAGVMTLADRAVLAVYCSAWSRWVRAEKAVAGDEILTSDGGGEYQNPHLAVANRAAETVAKLSSSLGLDPTARTRIKVAPAGEKKSAVRSRPRTALDG